MHWLLDSHAMIFSVVGEQKGFDGVYGPLYTYGVKSIKEI